jgi:hypothetical protein
MKHIFITLFALACFFSAAQNTQNIRGRVLDQQSETPLPGVNVLTNTGTGAVTDFDGYYVLNDVPVGRISLQFTFIGYKPLSMENLELTASKELIINASLRESAEQLAEVTVTAGQQKERTQNELVTVSGRTFSIEESQRFAGSVQDVSRMASNFAGVQRSNDSQNDIVIRGNSPIGLIWRMEGIDIPNPNHFGGFGATGGPVSMLNNNVLANSDFLTAAFPANYGDGLSGVFDLRLRNGNYEKHEFLGQIGFNGLEFGAEGPISREKKSSYLINYRYSTLGIMSAMGIDFGTGAAIPYYQDLNLKLNFPSRKIGNIEVFALGGISSIDFLESETAEDEDGGFYSDGEDLRNRVNTGVAGISHQYFFNKDTYTKVVLAATSTTNLVSIDTLNFDGSLVSPRYRQNFTEQNVQAHAFLNHKFSPKHVVRGGAFITHKIFDLRDSVYRKPLDTYIRILDQQSTDMLYQPYVNYQFRPNDRWEMNLGLHSMILASNGNYSLEPRFGASYNLTEKSSLNFGYGLHSQIAIPTILYDQIDLPDGTYIRLNEDLPFTQSNHLVVGYDQMMRYRLHFKAEAYYQYITDAIVEVQPSAFSSLNAGGFDTGTPDSVMTGGIGYNYGLDLTLEKFMDKGFYFLSTLSLYESQYQGSDKVWRNTAFNGNYVFNVLGGKEFLLSKKESSRRSTLTVDAKITTAGGQRYTPIDLAASNLVGEAVFDEDQAYGEQYDPYFRADIRIGFKLGGKKVTQEWAVDIQNVTNQQNPFGQNYNADTQEIETTNQLGLFPMVLYRITF